MLQPVSGIIDRVSLGHLFPGLTYEVAPALGAWLVAQGVAAEVPVAGRTETPHANDDSDYDHLTGGVTVNQTDRPLAVAHDKPPRRRRKR